MSSPVPDAAARFSDRVEDYVRFRPTYPLALMELLEAELGLGPGRTVADVGSGTGILTSLLLDTGSRVLAVEPNPAMRAAAAAALGGRLRFASVEGSAEATGLDDRSVDCVTAAQAFHWFRVDEAAREFARILRPAGWIALIWNTRRLEGSPFLSAYEAFLEEWGTDYTLVRRRYDVDPALPRLFGAGKVMHRTFPSHQALDQTGLEGRLLSSSYVPARDHPRCPAMLEALTALFAEHAEGGAVRMEYETDVYFGRVS